MDEIELARLLTFSQIRQKLAAKKLSSVEQLTLRLVGQEVRAHVSGSLHNLQSTFLSFRDRLLIRALEPDAAHGRKFSLGRKVGASGPITKYIRKLLTKNPKLSNKDLWLAVAKSPPKGWTAREGREGRYLDGPKGKTMAEKTLRNLAAKERAQLKIPV